MASTMSSPVTEQRTERFNCGKCAACSQAVWNYWYGSGRSEAISERMSKDPEVRKRIAHARLFLPKRTGPKVQDIAVAAIKAGKNFVETLKLVLEKIPDCQMKMASYNWYKAKIAKGILVLLILPFLGCVGPRHELHKETIHNTTINEPGHFYFIPTYYQEEPEQDLSAADQWEEIDYE